MYSKYHLLYILMHIEEYLFNIFKNSISEK